MTETRGALYFNPSSGARDPAIRDGLIPRCGEQGIDLVDIEPSLDLADDIRKRYDAGQRLFIAAGGDGTIHTVVQPLVNSEATLAVLPVGTFNHFARDLKIPLDWSEAFDVAMSGATIQVDAGAVNDQYFLNNISIGLYPDIVEEREQLRHYGKWKSYRRAAYAALHKFHHVHLNVETPHRLENLKTHVFLVSVNPYDVFSFGLIAPRETLGGGQLTVYWLPYMQKLQLIRTLARYFRGKMEPGADFLWMRTASLRVQTSRQLKVGMDGELHELKPPLVIRAVPKSVLVKVPR
jgi:diacylglycerol kinase family enzyme